MNPDIGLKIVLYLIFDRNCFKQVLKVNFPSLAASKYCDLTQSMPLNYVLI